MDPDIPADIDPAGELLAQENRNDNDEINAALLGENDPLGKSPPDFTIAWKHSDAHKVKNSRLIGDSSKAAKDEKNFCPWCRFPTSKIVPKYSLCTNAKNLSNLGLGFPLYYQMKKMIAIIYAVMIVIIGIEGVIINSVQNKGSEWVGGATPTFPVIMSIGNFGNKSYRYTSGGVYAELILNYLFTFGLFFISIILRRIQNQLIIQLNEENVTPSDFCVMITGIPKDKTQEEVKRFFKNIYKDIDIVYINYWYKIKAIVKASRKVKQLEGVKFFIQKYKFKKLKKLKMNEQEAKEKNEDLHPPPKKILWYKKVYPQKEKLVEDIKIAKEELEKIKKFSDKKSDNDLFNGTAFLIWNKQSQINYLINYFSIPIVKQVINFLIYKVMRCKNSHIDSRYWEGKRLYVERASEPTDVYWENLDVSTKTRLK